MNPLVQHLIGAAEAGGVLEELAAEIRRRGMLGGEGWRDELRSTIREELARAGGAPGASGDFMSVAQAANYLGIKPATVRDWISTGRLHAKKAGSRWRIKAEDLEAAMVVPQPRTTDREVEERAGAIIRDIRQGRKRGK